MREGEHFICTFYKCYVLQLFKISCISSNGTIFNRNVCYNIKKLSRCRNDHYEGSKVRKIPEILVSTLLLAKTRHPAVSGTTLIRITKFISNNSNIITETLYFDLEYALIRLRDMYVL